jgi:hypothetical protein
MSQSNELASVEGQLVGIPLQEYTAGPGIVVDNTNKTITFDSGTWEDVSTEANYNTNAVNTGHFELFYNANLKLIMLSVDANVKAGNLTFFTWTERLKPIFLSTGLGGGTGLYASQTSIYQASSAASRWLNGVWVWPVKGGSN